MAEKTMLDGIIFKIDNGYPYEFESEHFSSKRKT